MKIGIYEGVDALVTAVIKKTHKNDLNNLLSENFPDLFRSSQPFLQHLFTIPLPIRDMFTFFVLYGQENNLIMKKEIILAFGMLDRSKYSKITLFPEYNLSRNDVTPTLKNICRKKGSEWKGVGKHILKAVDNYAISHRISSIGLTAQHEKLIGYYQKHGFVLKENIHVKYMVKQYSEK